MRRTDGANKDTDAFGSGKHGYRATAPYTVLTPNAMNAIQEELARAIEGFGVALDTGNLAQLFQVLVNENRRSVSELDSSQPIIGTIRDSFEHPGAGTNIWKLFLYMECPDGIRVRAYAGDGGSQNFCITTNAVWNPANASQNWTKDDTAQESNQLKFSDGELAFYGRASGAGTWNNSSWTTTRGAVRAGSELISNGDLTVADDALISGDLHVDGTAVSDAGFITPGSTGGFSYAPVQVRTSMIQVADAFGDVFRNAVNGSVGSGAGGTVGWPVRLPDNFGGGDIEVAFYQDSTTPCTVRLISRAVNFSTGAVVRTVEDSFTGDASAGTDVKTLTVGAPVADTDYQLEFVRGDALDTINGFRMSSWQDGGPRNTF